MLNHAQPTPSSAAASTHGAASPSLELLEARQLRDALKLLLRKEQAAMADFLVALADFDQRRGWEPLGHASLFAFLHVELGLSKGAAYCPVRGGPAHPVVPRRAGPSAGRAALPLERRGAGPVATADNFDAVLPRFFGCSAREAREVSAAIAPRENLPVRDQVTRLASLAERRPETVNVSPDGEPVHISEARTAAMVVTLAATADAEAVRAHELALTHPARVAAPRDDVEPLTVRPPPAPRHGLQPLPEEAGHGPRWPLPRHPRRQHRAGAGGGAGPPSREAGQGSGAGEEAPSRRAAPEPRS